MTDQINNKELKESQSVQNSSIQQSSIDSLFNQRNITKTPKGSNQFRIKPNYNQQRNTNDKEKQKKKFHSSYNCNMKTQVTYENEQIQDLKQSCKTQVNDQQRIQAQSTLKDFIKTNQQHEQGKELTDMHNKLQNQYYKLEETIGNYKEKICLLDQIHNQVFQYDNSQKFKDQDIFNIQDSMHKLSKQLQSQADLEIKLNRKIKQMEVHQLDFLSIQVKLKKQVEMNRFLKKELDFFKQNKNLQDEQLAIQKVKIQQQLNVQKESNEKNQMISRRMEIILDNDLGIHLNNDDKIMITLNKLMKENDDQKRLIGKHQTEIKILQNQIKKHIVQREKYKETIVILKKEHTNMKVSDLHRTETNEYKIIENKEIPENLQFLQWNQNKEQQSFLSELLFHGFGVFKTLFSKSMKDVQDEEQAQMRIRMESIVRQFLLDRDVLSRLNSMLRQLAFMKGMDTHAEIQRVLEETVRGEVFSSDTLALWLLDSCTGVLISFNREGKEIKSYSDQGLFGEVLRTGIAVKKKNQLKRTCHKRPGEGEDIHVDNLIVMPIRDNQENLIGLLEVSNMDSQNDLGFDDEYLSIILATFLAQSLSQIKQHTLLKAQLNSHNQALQIMLSFASCTNRQQVQDILDNHMRVNLGINKFRLFFVVGQQMVYLEGEEEKRMALGQGVAGEVQTCKKQSILNHNQSNKVFNPKIDLYSIMPVLVLPIMSKEQNRCTMDYDCIGVLEVVLKQRLNLNKKLEEIGQPQVLNGLDHNTRQVVHSLLSALSLAMTSLQHLS